MHGSFKTEEMRKGKAVVVCVIASTLTSTIPNISLAGEMAAATLFTPALDVEYVQYGKPQSIDSIPTTPSGIPTPAVITRAALQLSNAPFIVVNSGSYVEPKLPALTLPSRRVGGRIDKEEALPRGTSKRLFSEAKTAGKTFSSLSDVVLIGESMPGGTTTALSILKGLGMGDYSSVSSSSNVNPIDIKKSVVEAALKRAEGMDDPFEINDVLGDPLHISIAGIAIGALSGGSHVILAGGTQMLAALALMRASGEEFDEEKVSIATTKWVFDDKGEKMGKLVGSLAPGASLVYADLSFSDSPFEGLKAYDEGFVKEGVGAGGTSVLALLKGRSVEDLKRSIYIEYERLMKMR
ncbi:MAG: nicotinate mononucleotide-dependent phosphoribosyltransferase CobT [Fervidicoccaceae archaeon]